MAPRGRASYSSGARQNPSPNPSPNPDPNPNPNPKQESAAAVPMEPLVLAITDRERRGDGGAVDARFNDHEKHRWEHEP